MSIISDVKEIADLVKKIGDIDLYRRIVELEGEIIELTRRKRELEERVDDLEKLLSFSKEMKWQKPFYIVEGEEDPYCPRCWECEKLPVHVTDSGIVATGRRWDCPKCNNIFMT